MSNPIHRVNIDLSPTDIARMAQFINACPEPPSDTSAGMKAIYWNLRSQFDSVNKLEPGTPVEFLVSVR